MRPQDPSLTMYRHLKKGEGQSALNPEVSRIPVRTCVANASVIDLDADFVCLGRGNFDVFKGQVLASFPRHSSLYREGQYYLRPWRREHWMGYIESTDLASYGLVFASPELANDLKIVGLAGS